MSNAREEQDSQTPAIIFHDTGEIRRFETISSAIDFFEQQKRWYDGYSANVNTIELAKQEIDKVINRLSSVLKKLQRRASSLPLSSAIAAEITEEVRVELSSNGRMVINDSPDGKLVDESSSAIGRTFAGSLLATMLKDEKWQGTLDPHLASTYAFYIVHKCITRVYVYRIEEQERKIQQLLAVTSTFRAEFKSLIDDTKKRFDDLELLYREKLAVQAPVSYWESRARSCYMWFWGSFGLAAAVLLVGGLLVYYVYGTSMTHLTSTSMPSPWNVLPIWFPVLITTLTVIWMLRILVRVALSNLHLATDAAERVTLAKTYLALSEDNSDVGKEGRAHVLSQLFRRATTGFINDDAAPIFPTTPKPRDE